MNNYSENEIISMKDKILLEIEVLQDELFEKQKKLKELNIVLHSKCTHNWEKQSDSGPYPCKWLQCSKCSLII